MFIYKAIVECGFAAYAMVALSFVGIALALVTLGLALARSGASVAVGAFALMVSLGAVALGPVGTIVGKRRVDDILRTPFIDAAYVERIRAEGYAEAGRCTQIGVGAGSLPTALSVAALLLAVGRRRKAVGRD